MAFRGDMRVGKLPSCGMGINVAVLSECEESRIQEGFLEEWTSLWSRMSLRELRFS